MRSSLFWHVHKQEKGRDVYMQILPNKDKGKESEYMQSLPKR